MHVPLVLFFLIICGISFVFEELQNYAHTFILQVAITSERLHKQSVVIKQICKLFPQRRVK